MPEPPKETRFKKGQSGNPKGRPKGSRNKSTIVKEIIETIVKGKNPITGEDIEIPLVDQMVLAATEQALKGNIQALKELMDIAYGKNADIVHNVNYNDMSEEELDKELKELRDKLNDNPS